MVESYLDAFTYHEIELACGDYKNATIDEHEYASGTYLYRFKNGIGGVNGVAYDPSGPIKRRPQAKWGEIRRR